MNAPNLIATAKDPHTRLRMPQRLMEHMQAASSRNGRSLNSELLVRLWHSVQLEDDISAEERQ